jgi:hypothetical protein
MWFKRTPWHAVPTFEEEPEVGAELNSDFYFLRALSRARSQHNTYTADLLCVGDAACFLADSVDRGSLGLLSSPNSFGEATATPARVRENPAG